jgi:DNA-binding transcriptional LysR family regulator
MAASGSGEQMLPRLRFKLEELETFLTVAETGSFSRAADKLGLSQPSVTSRVQRLENAMGVSLFARTTRRVALTEDGVRLRKTADAALRDLRLLLRDFQSEAETRKHRLTLAATPLLAAVVLMPIIRRYMNEHPRSEIKLHDVPVHQALAELSSGRADMAIMVFDGHHPAYRFDLLTVEECVVVTPPDHPLLAKREVSFEDIVQYTMLLPDFYQPLRTVLEAEYLKRGLPFKPMVQMNDVSNIATVIGMVAAGMGITFAPRSLISLDQRGSIGIVKIKGFRVERRYGVVALRDKPMSALARSFTRFVRAQIPDPAGGWSA